MRKYLFFAFAAFALFSCSKENGIVENQEPQARSFKYVFTVADKPSFDADTKAVKDSWTEGDKIFIVFDDVLPTALTDCMILEYKEGDWTVAQEPATAPNEAGGTLDALYFEQPEYEITVIDDSNGGFAYFSPYIDGQYMYMVSSDVPYTVEDSELTASISMDFELNNVRTYVQLRIKDLPESTNGWGLLSTDPIHDSDNDLSVFVPIWQKLNNRFNYISLYAGNGYGDFALGKRDDGHYLYLSVYQGAEEITFALVNYDTFAIYEKTFSRQISGKCAAITFKGPQLDENGIPTNGWTTTVEQEIDGHACVDMGDGLMWATMNVGAGFPEDAGDFFAWGEVEPYYSALSPLAWKEGKEAGYAKASYRFYNEEDETTFTKYTGTDYTVLQSEDDAAAANWEGAWRTPTKAEWMALIDNCSWQKSSRGGVEGVLVTSKATRNSIFIPTAGSFQNTSFYGDDCLYWTATPNGKLNAVMMYYGSGALVNYVYPRYVGLPVRAVTETPATE